MPVPRLSVLSLRALGGLRPLALVWALGGAALAADMPAPATLAGALEQAWRQHPLAAGLDARMAEARAALDLAGAATPQPAAVTVGHLNDRLHRNLGRREWELELAVPLWLRGQQDARRDDAQGRIQLATAQRAALRLTLAGSLREAWWALAGARASLALAGRKHETAQALYRNVQRRHSAGELSRIDANLAQGEVLLAEAELAGAQAAVRQAEQALQLLTGSPAPPVLAEEAAAAPRPGETHPLLQVAGAAADSAQAHLRLSLATPRAAPELAVRVLRERADLTERYGNQVGLRLTVPFAMGAQIRRDTSAAQAEVAEADAQRQRASDRLALDLERAQQLIDTQERLLRVAAERVALASDSLHLAEKAFALGESDLATLLRLRNTAFDALGAHERQRIGHAAARSALNQALGALP